MFLVQSMGVEEELCSLWDLSRMTVVDVSKYTYIGFSKNNHKLFEVRPSSEHAGLGLRTWAQEERERGTRCWWGGSENLKNVPLRDTQNEGSSLRRFSEDFWAPGGSFGFTGVNNFAHSFDFAMTYVFNYSGKKIVEFSSYMRRMNELILFHRFSF